MFLGVGLGLGLGSLGHVTPISQYGMVVYLRCTIVQGEGRN